MLSIPGLPNTHAASANVKVTGCKDGFAKVFISYVQASVTCALTGPLQIKDYKAISGPEGHEVFSERKGLSLFQNKVNKTENYIFGFVAEATEVWRLLTTFRQCRGLCRH